MLHPWVIREPFTRICASLTYLGTNLAGVRMKFRATQHEVGAGLTYLSTIQHEANVSWVGVLTAHLEAVGYRFKQTS
jgi:hypothetical protein